MIRKFFSLLLILCCGPLVSSLIADEPQQTAQNFNERLNQAYRILLSNDPAQGIVLFEELLAANPNEWLIYDAYAQALKSQGKFDQARQVYEKALASQIPAITPWRREDIRHRIATLEEQKKFTGDMSKAPLWDQARVFGSQSFVVKTNIPETYYYPVALRIQAILAEERKLLEQIFGKSEKVPPMMNIYLFGRYSEYINFIQGNRDARQQRIPVYYSAYYEGEQKLLGIYFNGVADWEEIAHEMAHFLLSELYVKDPSRWLNEGLAQYVAFKVEKDSAKAIINWILEFLNWNYDQGVWSGFDDFFTLWEKYEHELHYNPFSSKPKIFYYLSWTLVHFFLDGENPNRNAFFKDYLNFEEESGTVTYATVQAYFKDHLSAEKYKELENQWIKHTLNMTYENV